MRTGLQLTLTLALLVITNSASAQEKNIEALEEQAFKQAAIQVDASMVRITTSGGLDVVGKVLTSTAPTTGVVVSEDGYIVTSTFNFASKPTGITVRLNDGRRFNAKVVAADQSRMLTLLKIDVEGLTPAVATPKKEIKVGHWALALGRTYDSEFPSISIGIISAQKRIWGKALQTDAKISPINYGGPLTDVQGRVMGILVPLSTRAQGETAGVEWYDSGIGFAVPLEDVYSILDRLKNGETLKTGLMGIAFAGRDIISAVPTVSVVRPASPADEAGIEKGDVLTKIDGQPVLSQNQVKQAIGDKYAGDTIEVVVKRDGKELTKKLTLVGELKPYESGFLGILPRREPVSAPATDGVVVRYVYPGSPAEAAGLMKRDRIIQYQDTKLTNAESLLDLVKVTKPEEKVKIVFVRDDKEQTKEVTLSGLPDKLAANLDPTAIPVFQKPEGEEGPKTGRFTATVNGRNDDYWAFVPDGYNPDYQYGLMVWLHPGGDTMEAMIYKRWKLLCERQGVIILAPKAGKISGWSANEAEFVSDAIKEMTETYSIDPTRVFLHAHQDSTGFAMDLVFKYRDVIKGAAVAGAPLRKRPEENDPDYRQQFYFVGGDQNPVISRIEQSVSILQKMKYSVIFKKLADKGEEYPDDALEDIILWADALDRI